MYSSLSTITASLTPRLVAIVLFVALGNTISGYDSASFGGVQSIPAFAKRFGEFDESLHRYALPASVSSLLTSISFVGKLVGIIAAGPCIERYGHRTGLVIMSLATIIGAIIQLTSKTAAQFLVGRIFVFIGVGFVVNVVPTYQSEILPAASRGFLVSSAQVFILIGNLVATGVNRFYSKFQTSQGWIIPVSIQLITPTIILCGAAFVPPSPRWLLYKGRRDEALRVLESVRRPVDVQAGLCVEEINKIEELRLHESLKKRPWADLFRGTNRRRTTIAAMVFMYHQFTGQVFMNQYATVFYIRVGLAANAFDYVIIATAASGVACLIGMYLIDTLGRRPVLIVGAFVQALWLFLVGGIGSLAHPTRASQHMVVAAATLFTVSYNISWSPLSLVVASEIGTNSLREKTMALSSGLEAISGFVVSFTLPYLLNPPYANLQARLGYIYGSIAASAMIYAFLFVPETKGRSLEELDELFAHKPSLPAWKFRAFITAGARAAAVEGEDGAEPEDVKTGSGGSEEGVGATGMPEVGKGEKAPKWEEGVH